MVARYYRYIARAFERDYEVRQYGVTALSIGFNWATVNNSQKLPCRPFDIVQILPYTLASPRWYRHACHRFESLQIVFPESYNLTLWGRLLAATNPQL